jgi:hypothetical protein
LLFDFARQVLSWLLSDFKISRFELDEFQDREEAGVQFKAAGTHSDQSKITWFHFAHEQQGLASLLIRDDSQALICKMHASLAPSLAGASQH